jgi:hypothetical protein
MRLSTFAHLFPGDHDQLHDREGRLTMFGHGWHRALFDRTGGGSGIIPSVVENLIAQGNTQLSALLLKDDWNHIATTAANTGVQVPHLQRGQEIYIANDGVSPLKIYPWGGWQIDGLGVNAAYLLAAGKMQKFKVIGITTLRSLQLG